MKKILQILFDHKTLESNDAKEVLIQIASGKYTEAEIAAFLTVFLMRSITVEELIGFRDALLELCTRVDFSDFETIDLCGSGGDEKNTFNISTLSSFIVAGSGIKVAKHGNYAVSSSCGSSNILEYFGYKFTNNYDILKNQVDKAGICFLHAPLFNPAMKNVAPVRKNLKIKTFFNMLGPLVNPSFPKNQLVGVYSLELMRLYNYIFQQTGKNYAIVHALDGYDEISLTGKFKIITPQKDVILQPEDINLKTCCPSDIYGGSTVEESAKIFKNVLDGKGTEYQNNVVLANSAYAIQCIKQNLSIHDCIEIAKKSLFSGNALTALKKLVENN